MAVQIMTPVEGYIVRYPQAVEIAEKQSHIIWFAEELGIPKDEDDIRTKLSEGERHGLITTLKLFTKYELMLGGEEFWGGKVRRMFPRPEIQRMASVFSFAELGMHAPFYNLINQVLHIDNEEFYNSWMDSPVLVDRINFIHQYAEEESPLVSMAAFAFMEGAVLFSNFSFIKSLNSGGYNMAPHITAGIDASAKDENIHSMASAWLYNQTLEEMKEAKLITEYQIRKIKEIIREIAKKVYDHEAEIVNMIFSKGGIRTITEENMLHFIRNRIDMVLSYLKMRPMFGDKPGVVSEWFYNQLSAFKYSDFFAAQQVQYVRNWRKHLLTFRSYVEE